MKPPSGDLSSLPSVWLTGARRGEFATDDQVRDLWQKHSL